MKALIRKDLATIKNTLILVLLVCIVIGFYAFNQKIYIMIPAIYIVMSLILTSIAQGYDVKANFEQFAFCLPIDRKDYVFSKLFIAFAFGILAAFSIFIILSIKTSIKTVNITLFSLLSFITCLLVSAIQLPFSLKFGTEKGKIVFIVTYALIFICISLLKDHITEMVRYLNSYSAITIGFSVCFICLLIISLCVYISIKVIQNKEF
ncbi:MAG: ABC-2 transporter permease [Peptoniphilaceae bacterium]|nr:ABC-2 transporter permease [Peptoniphilaceae bacterium]MDY6019404.1 ABC-2 transporter permease [Anaerococcus sp.]